MRVWVNCEGCEHRQPVRRLIFRPEVLHIICHGCEKVLDVRVTWEDISNADRRLTRV